MCGGTELSSLRSFQFLLKLQELKEMKQKEEIIRATSWKNTKNIRKKTQNDRIFWSFSNFRQRFNSRLSNVVFNCSVTNVKAVRAVLTASNVRARLSQRCNNSVKDRYALQSKAVSRGSVWTDWASSRKMKAWRAKQPSQHRSSAA